MARKFRLVDVPAGAYGPDYKPGIRKLRLQQEKLRREENRDRSVEIFKAAMRKCALEWGVAPEDVDLFVESPEAYRAEMDRRARAHVEGDATLNDQVQALP